MPRPLTGRKNGRPTKADKPFFTSGQKAYIKSRAADPEMSGANIAKKLKVTRQAVWKWRQDNTINQEIEKQVAEIKNHNQQVLTAKIKAKRKEAQAVNDLKEKAKLEARVTEYSRLTLNRRIYLQSMIEKDWTGPTTLPGGEIVFHTKREYLEALMALPGVIPYDDAVNLDKKYRS